jgi:hypothetical protein
MKITAVKTAFSTATNLIVKYEKSRRRAALNVRKVIIFF